MPLLAGSNNESAITVQQLPPEPVIFGQTPAMRDVRQKLERVAGANLSVLISGESGTGKDIVARLLHLYSPWSSGPFVKVNCPATSVYSVGKRAIWLRARGVHGNGLQSQARSSGNGTSRHPVPG